VLALRQPLQWDGGDGGTMAKRRKTIPIAHADDVAPVTHVDNQSLDTLVHYRQVLDSVTYNSTSSNLTNFGADTSRTISWVVNDGTLNSAPQTTTLTITAQEAAPALQWDGGDGGTMAKKDPASKRLADETARLPEEDQAIQQFRSEILAAEEFEDKKRRGRARADANLRRALCDLVPKLKRAYGQPARDEADERSQHVFALLAFAHFLKQMGPDYLADCANQFGELAQKLQDLNDGVRAPIFTPALASRSDQTVVWLARAYVALAIETLRRGGYARGRTRNRDDHPTGRLRQKSAAKWAAKRYPGLKQLITESGADIERSKSVEKAIISWCEDFSSGKVKNHNATHVYSVGLDKLKAWAPNRNSDQMEDEADRLLQEALRLI